MNDRPIANTRSELYGDMFGRYARDFFSPYLDGEDRGFSPKVEIRENPKNYLVRVEIPGMSEEDLIVTLQDNSLVIEGKKQKTKSEEGEYYRSEFSYGTFHRTIPLKYDVDDNNITAKYIHGILTIALVKKEDGIEKTHRILINRE